MGKNPRPLSLHECRLVIQPQWAGGGLGWTRCKCLAVKAGMDSAGSGTCAARMGSVAVEAASSSTGPEAGVEAEADVEMELEVGMQRIQRIAITAVFTLTCFTVPVLTAATLDKAASGEAGPGEIGTGAGRSTKPTKNLAGGAGAVDQARTKGPTVTSASQGGSGATVETKPEWAEGTALAEQVKQITDQFRKEQQDLLNRYRELLKKTRDAGSEERDRLRQQLKVEWDKLRDDLISKQKDLRDAIRRQFEEFKQSHPDHQDLIEAAKEQAKDRVRERRGHGAD